MRTTTPSFQVRGYTLGALFASACLQWTAHAPSKVSAGIMARRYATTGFDVRVSRVSEETVLEVLGGIT